MDQELHHELRPRGPEWHRDEAKRLLRAVGRGEPSARARAREVLGARMDERRR